LDSSLLLDYWGLVVTIDALLSTNVIKGTPGSKCYYVYRLIPIYSSKLVQQAQVLVQFTRLKSDMSKPKTNWSDLIMLLNSVTPM